MVARGVPRSASRSRRSRAQRARRSPPPCPSASPGMCVPCRQRARAARCCSALDRAAGLDRPRSPTPDPFMLAPLSNAFEIAAGAVRAGRRGRRLLPRVRRGDGLGRRHPRRHLGLGGPPGVAGRPGAGHRRRRPEPGAGRRCSTPCARRTKPRPRAARPVAPAVRPAAPAAGPRRDHHGPGRTEGVVAGSRPAGIRARRGGIVGSWRTRAAGSVLTITVTGFGALARPRPGRARARGGAGRRRPRRRPHEARHRRLTRRRPPAGRVASMTVVKINAITVPADSGGELARRFAARAGAVDDQDGFEGFELLQPTDDADHLARRHPLARRGVVPRLDVIARLRTRPPVGGRTRGRRRTARPSRAQRAVVVRRRRRQRRLAAPGRRARRGSGVGVDAELDSQRQCPRRR